MSARAALLRANAEYARTFARGRPLPRVPARSVAVVTCMDARLDPARFFGLAEGDAHVIRNAGAVVTDDVIRSLVVSHGLLGTREALLVGHTDCGMEASADELRGRLVGAADVDLRAFEDVEASVRAGVRAIAAAPALRGLVVTGWLFEVDSGRVRKVRA